MNNDRESLKRQAREYGRKVRNATLKPTRELIRVRYAQWRRHAANTVPSDVLDQEYRSGVEGW